jgi:biotin transport system substrate-specific component
VLKRAKGCSGTTSAVVSPREARVGYQFAWPVAAGLVGALAARGWDRRLASALPAMLLGNLVILLCRFAWLAAATWLISGALNLPALLAASVCALLRQRS